MKLIQKILLLSLALANGSLVGAQSNSIPGDTDYARFSQFISERNIFDPNRFPHEVHTSHHHVAQRSNSAPAFTLVGTMSYQKGMFAFFSGNTYDLKKILPVSGTIAGYAVTEVTPNSVKIQGADKKEIVLQIGDQMREENNGWQLLALGDAPAGSGTGESSSSAPDNSSASSAADSTTVVPSASVSNNDVLKRLMQLREQENK
jgi:hypothetical protein